MNANASLLIAAIALGAWILIAIASVRVERSRWWVMGTVCRIVLGVCVAAGLRWWMPGWPMPTVAVATAVVLLSAEIPSWLFSRGETASRRVSAPADPADGLADGNGSHATRLDDAQRRFLSGLLSLKKKTVAQAMVTREHMVTVNQDWSAARAVRAVASTRYARIPVVGRNPREVVGVVHRKDLLLLLHTHQEGTFVKNVSRDVDFAPGSQRLDRLLVKFQKERIHLAVVPDEYGRAAGLITMDDILTEALAPWSDT
jgi:CBS domain containing-hemolysin-like protein